VRISKGDQVVKELTIKWRDLRDLDLDPENPRHDRGLSRSAVIALFVKRENIKRLARDIAENGLSPLERFGAIKDAQNELIVVEGNRRLCALMLLHDPSLAPTPEDRKAFERYAKKFDPSGVELKLQLFDSREEADVWLERKHLGENGGLGTRGWDPVQQARHFGETDNTLALALIDYGVDHRLVSSRPEGILTTVTRFVSNPYVRRHALLITTGRNVPEFEFTGTRALFNRRLHRLLNDIINGENGATSRTSAPDREQYAKTHLVPITDDGSGDQSEEDETLGSADDTSPAGSGGRGDTSEGTESPADHDERTGADEESAGEDHPTGDGEDDPAGEGESGPANRPADPRKRNKLVEDSQFNPSLRDNGLRRILGELQLVTKRTPALAAVGVRIFIEAVTVAYIENRLEREVSDREKLHVLVGEALDDVGKQAREQALSLTTKEKNALKMLRNQVTNASYVYSAAYLGAVAHGSAFPQWEHLTASWDEIAPILLVLATNCEKPLTGRE